MPASLEDERERELDTKREKESGGEAGREPVEMK